MLSHALGRGGGVVAFEEQAISTLVVVAGGAKALKQTRGVELVAFPESVALASVLVSLLVVVRLPSVEVELSKLSSGSELFVAFDCSKNGAVSLSELFVAFEDRAVSFSLDIVSFASSISSSSSLGSSNSSDSILPPEVGFICKRRRPAGLPS
jgi:hypothetical protein